MNKQAHIALLLLLLTALTACSGRLNPALPEDATAFACFDYVNPQDPEDDYLALEYQGRTYLPYGTLGTSLHLSDLGPCLGYPVQEGEAQTDLQICLLAADPQANFLVELFPEAVMQQPVFYRALDSSGKEIDIPEYIESLEYPIWE